MKEDISKKNNKLTTIEIDQIKAQIVQESHYMSDHTIKHNEADTREITHSYDTATVNGKRSSPIVLRSTPWRFPAISRALKPVTHIIMCSVYFKGENLSVTVSALCF